MGILIAICTSEQKGTRKRPRPSARLIPDHGLEHDAHAGPGHRQVSLLSLEKIEAFKQRGAVVEHGDFGENLVVDGIDFAALPLGARLSCGEALLELTQHGKECHHRCAIYHAMGDCIMPREGVFAKVLKGGLIREGDAVAVVQGGPVPLAVRNPAAQAYAYAVAILTVSDKGFAGEREDRSGAVIREIVEGRGWAVVRQSVLPDEQAMISAALAGICNNGLADLILTTGGTGFSPRDVTPEATLAVVERLCPGIPEAMRAHSLAITRRAMLSRAVAGIRGRTLIVNLPGSPKAVAECLEFAMDSLTHGLDILTNRDGECARS